MDGVFVGAGVARREVAEPGGGRDHAGDAECAAGDDRGPHRGEVGDEAGADLANTVDIPSLPSGADDLFPAGLQRQQ
ncbi:MAG TPA: hypothetical protein VFB74_33715 [Kribbellaceae bacterium]|nr:hypothetical protein [Kribbellaceae bacterium]